MIEEEAIVVCVSENKVWVEPLTRSSCGGCVRNQGCSSSFLSRSVGKRRISVDTEILVTPGDSVVVGLDEGALLKGSLVIYLIPLIALFVSGFAGDYAFSRMGLGSFSDAGGAVFAISGFLLSFTIIKRIQRVLFVDPRLRPVVLRKL